MLEGIEELDAPLNHAATLPEDWTGKRILLRMTGGIGDELIAFGGAVSVLKQRDCFVGAAAKRNHLELLVGIEGIDAVHTQQDANSVDVLRHYDIVLNFNGIFVERHSLRKESYYELVSRKLGYPATAGRFKGNTREFFSKTTIALHTTASNPNRRWEDNRWLELAYTLAENGMEVLFLGDKDDYGFTDKAAGIFKCSDLTSDLLTQAGMLAACKYFCGVDSGFCHIAGMLGVTGWVLFTNTLPETVIAEYDSLVGLHAFDVVGEPTRSLNPTDARARAASSALTVDRVWRAICPNGSHGGKLKRDPVRLYARVQITGDCLDAFLYADYLKEYYDVQLIAQPFGEVGATLHFDGSEYCQVKISATGKETRIAVGNMDEFRMAFRDLLRGAV